MTIRLLVIFALVWQPLLLGVGAWPCGGSMTEAGWKPAPPLSCCPAPEPAPTCCPLGKPAVISHDCGRVAALCGCETPMRDQPTPPGPVQNRAYEAALAVLPRAIADLFLPEPPRGDRGASERVVGGYSAHDVRSILCVWLT